MRVFRALLFSFLVPAIAVWAASLRYCFASISSGVLIPSSRWNLRGYIPDGPFSLSCPSSCRPSCSFAAEDKQPSRSLTKGEIAPSLPTSSQLLDAHCLHRAARLLVVFGAAAGPTATTSHIQPLRQILRDSCEVLRITRPSIRRRCRLRSESRLQKSAMSRRSSRRDLCVMLGTRPRLPDWDRRSVARRRCCRKIARTAALRAMTKSVD